MFDSGSCTISNDINSSISETNSKMSVCLTDLPSTNFTPSGLVLQTFIGNIAARNEELLNENRGS